MDRKQAREKAEELVSRMTLEEKAGQLTYSAPAIPRLGIPEYNWWSEAVHGISRAGTATVFPQAIGLAAMFDTDGMRRIAEAIATEGRAKFNLSSGMNDRDAYKGLTFWSPNINIFRDPRWGRGQETYGEDPYLTGRLAVAYVKGMQGDGAYLKSAACAKHFAVHSGPESLRHELDVTVSPKDLRETYLPAFEAIVREGGVEAVMGAYNRVNGEPACASKVLMEGILRGEWGFEGHFVSDCWAIADFHKAHGVTDTPVQSAALAISRGCDLNCGNTYLYLLAAVQEGLIDEGLIHRSAVRLFTTRCLLGLFDERCAYNSISPLENDSDAHAALALEAAEKSIVLLKNDGLLPLKKVEVRTIAVIGPLCDSQVVLQGNYSGISSRFVTFLEGVRKAFDGSARVLYAQGAHLEKDRSARHSRYPNDRLQEAVWLAGCADLTILCVGLDTTLEGEEGEQDGKPDFGDKKDLLLPESQRPLLEAVRLAAKKLVTIVSSGSALDVREGNAVLWTGYPGQAGGTALARLLLGEAVPSGKLPITFYRNEEALPDIHDYAMASRTYRYHGQEALYPFGFGLSYARFIYSNPTCENGVLEVDVHNESGMDAEEVVQVYAKAHSPHAPRNARLAGFVRVAVKGGQRVRARVKLDDKLFRLYNNEGEIEMADTMTLFVGGSQPDRRSIQLMGQEPLCLEVHTESKASLF